MTHVRDYRTISLVGICENIQAGAHGIKLKTKSCPFADAGVEVGPVEVGFITGTTYMVEEVRLEWLPLSLTETGTMGLHLTIDIILFIISVTYN